MRECAFHLIVGSFVLSGGCGQVAFPQFGGHLSYAASAADRAA